MAKKTAVKEKPQVDHDEIAKPAQSKGELVVMAPVTTEYVKNIMTADLVKSLTYIKPEVFERNLFNALAANQALLEHPPFYVYREVSKAAALGLLLDPLLGEAYMIEAYDGKKKRKLPQLRVGYKGMIKLARQSGNVAGLWCHEIYSGDEVEVDLGFPKVFHHRPKLFVDRGTIIGYAAVIAYKDGTFDFEPMSTDECLKIRDRSDAWKAYKGGFIKSTPWSTDEGEMCKKTAFRRLMKRQEQSPQMREAIRIEDEAEFPHLVDTTAEPSPPAQIRAPAPPPEDTQPAAKSADISAERDAKPKKARGPRGAPEPEQAPAEDVGASFVKLAGKELTEFVKKTCAGVTPEMIEKNPELLDEMWNVVIEPHLKDAFPPDVSEVMGIFNKTVARLSP